MSMDTREDQPKSYTKELVDESPMCSNCGTRMRKSSVPDTWQCPNMQCSASIRPEFIQTRVAAEFSHRGQTWIEADDDSGLMAEKDGQVMVRPITGQLLDSVGNSKVMGLQTVGPMNILEEMAKKSFIIEKDSNGDIQLYKIIKATRKSIYDNGQKETPFDVRNRSADSE